MKQLHFTYDMRIDYTLPVTKGFFTEKCVPQNTLRQSISNLQVSIQPSTDYSQGLDHFGNIQLYGVHTEPHDSFLIHVEGDAQTGLSAYEALSNPNQDMIFAHPHGLNCPGHAIQAFHRIIAQYRQSDTLQTALAYMQALHDHYRYVPGATTVDTPAEQAFCQCRGVCQDYAHIFIALLQLSGIPARYVTGFLIGEGESHAWVELLSDGKWYGIDPTNNTFVDEKHIRIAIGRHAKDCLMNRGILYGGGLHTQQIRVCVTEK